MTDRKPAPHYDGVRAFRMTTPLIRMANRLTRALQERDRLIYWAIGAYREAPDGARRWGLWTSLAAIGIDPDSAEADAILARGEPRLEPRTKDDYP